MPKGIGAVEAMREPVEPCRIVVLESARRRRPPERLPQSVSRLHEKPAIAPGKPGGTQAGDVPFARALDLGLFRRPGLRCVDERLGDRPQVALGLDKAVRQPVDQRVRRLVRNEMAHKLGRDMSCRRWMTREIRQHRPALLEAGIAIGFSEHGLGAGLVHAAVEEKLAAMLGIAVGRQDGPAGDDLREIRHIVLGIDRAHAERMQFQNFAREVLVQSSVAVDAGD